MAQNTDIASHLYSSCTHKLEMSNTVFIVQCQLMRGTRRQETWPVSLLQRTIEPQLLLTSTMSLSIPIPLIAVTLLWILLLFPCFYIFCFSLTACVISPMTSRSDLHVPPALSFLHLLLLPPEAHHSRQHTHTQTHTNTQTHTHTHTHTHKVPWFHHFPKMMLTGSNHSNCLWLP